MASDYMKHRVKRLRELAAQPRHEDEQQELTLAANALQTMLDQHDATLARLRDLRARSSPAGAAQ